MSAVGAKPSFSERSQWVVIGLALVGSGGKTTFVQDGTKEAKRLLAARTA